MLQNLHVKNLALIPETEVEFQEGLNILTGETGAGKSIIIGSLLLALGEKVQKEMLRDPESPALVELFFSVEDDRLLAALAALDIEPEDGCVVLSRKISGGRAVARINGETVPASRMREAAALLIDIHGQHEHQSLLSKKKHLEILDAYAGTALKQKKDALAESYRAYRECERQWQSANTDGEERARELSFLAFEAKEIRSAALTTGEDTALEEQFRKFENAKKIMDALAVCGAACGADDGDQNASALIGRALREIGTVSQYDGRIAQLEAMLSDAENLLGDFNRELSAYMDGAEFDGEAFYETQNRLDEINRLKAKYGGTIEEILRAADEKEARIAVLQDYDTYLRKLSEDFSQKKAALDQLCAEVSALRRAAAPKLCGAIAEALRDLNFLDVRFTMELKETDYSANGTDEAEFLISTNPGEPLLPLGRVASGGELSRIALAVKTVMASDAIPTLIFDEIDSGISGRTAQMVSQKMKRLAKSHQIICITHLPQIAAMADTHFLIEKSVENETTVSRIHTLTDEESVTELARMLGGVEITETVRKNAREMKELAAKFA